LPSWWGYSIDVDNGLSDLTSDLSPKKRLCKSQCLVVA